MKKLIIGTYFKTYKLAIKELRLKEKAFGRGKFVIFSNENGKGFVIVSGNII